MTQTRRRTQAERCAESDRQLFDSATRLIIERGPERTTLSEVGVRAGYSRGIASYHYKNKDNFFTALVDHLHQAWYEELALTYAETRGTEAIVGAVSALQRFIATRPDRLRAMYSLYYYSMDQQSVISAKLQEIHTRQRREAARMARQALELGEANPALDPERYGQQYCSLIFGAIYQWLVNPDEVPLYPVLEDCKQSLRALLQMAHNPIREHSGTA